MDISVGEVNKVLNKIELPLGAAGFVYGVTKMDIDVAVSQGLWDNYDAEKKTKYILHNLLGRTTGYDPFPEFGKAPGFTIKPTGFLNKGLAVAIAAYLYKEFNLPYANTVKKLLFPLGAGFAVGGVFDPPAVPARSDRRDGRTSLVATPQSAYWSS